MLKKVRLRERTYNYSFRGKAQILFSIIQTFRRNFEEFKCDTVSASGFLFFSFFFFGQVTKTVQIDFYNSAKCIFVFVSLQLIFFSIKT